MGSLESTANTLYVPFDNRMEFVPIRCPDARSLEEFAEHYDILIRGILVAQPGGDESVRQVGIVYEFKPDQYRKVPTDICTVQYRIDVAYQLMRDLKVEKLEDLIGKEGWVWTRLHERDFVGMSRHVRSFAEFARARLTEMWDKTNPWNHRDDTDGHP